MAVASACAPVCPRPVEGERGSPYPSQLRDEEPERVDRQGLDLASVREGLLARVQDIARNEPVAKTACQVPEPGEVVRTNCRAGFDLDGYDAAVGCLDDGVDFQLVLGPVVVEVSAFLGRIPAGVALRPDPREVAAILTPSLEELWDPAARGELRFRSARWPDGLLVDGIPVEGRVLWGMTLRLLDDLAPRLLAGEWEL